MYSKAYIDYLIHFHTDRDYFECHEILEEYWKQDTIINRKQFLVALIQVAVGMYHYRNRNLNGARKVFNKSIYYIYLQIEELSKLDINTDLLLQLIKTQIEQIDSKVPYKSINLPLNDNLLHYCLQYCRENHLNWGLQSDISNNELIYKHKLRDRSEIITERNNQLNLRKIRANLINRD